MVGGERGRDLGERSQLSLRDRVARRLAHLGAGLLEDLLDSLGGEGAAPGEEIDRREQRIARLDLLDLGICVVFGLDIAPGVAQQAHDPPVEERGLARRAHVVDRLARRTPRIAQIEAVAAEVGDVGPRAEPSLHPAGRSLHRDPDPVVLANVKNRDRKLWWQAHAAVLKPDIATLWLIDASPSEAITIASLATAIGNPNRFARSWAKASPVAFGMWEAIVLVCGGTQRRLLPHTLWRPRRRIVDRRDEGEHRVADRSLPFHLASARHHESAAAIVDEGRVVDPEQLAEDRVRLVAGAPDRVVAGVLVLQLACLEVERAARDHRLEDARRLRRREVGIGAQPRVGGERRARRRRELLRHASGDIALDDLSAGDGHRRGANVTYRRALFPFPRGAEHRRSARAPARPSARLRRCPTKHRGSCS